MSTPLKIAVPIVASLLLTGCPVDEEVPGPDDEVVTLDVPSEILDVSTVMSPDSIAPDLRINTYHQRYRGLDVTATDALRIGQDEFGHFEHVGNDIYRGSVALATPNAYWAHTIETPYAASEAIRVDSGMVYIADWEIDLNNLTINATNTQCVTAKENSIACDIKSGYTTSEDSRSFITGIVSFTTDRSSDEDMYFNIDFEGSKNYSGIISTVHRFGIVPGAPAPFPFPLSGE
ncbi:hypothetical protein OAV62_00465 [bacterium]|nr:hypothetical protein [bacterium]